MRLDDPLTQRVVPPPDVSRCTPARTDIRGSNRLRVGYAERARQATPSAQVLPSINQRNGEARVVPTSVMMHTFPDSLRDISHANFGGQLRDFREIPGDD